MKNSIKRFLFSFMVAVLMINSVVFATEPPAVTAETAILIEVSTGKTLYSKDIHKKMFPASMTKILTALITLDYFSPDALITVGNEINEISWDSSKAGHIRGETLSVENLLRGLMIPSGNDSANVLAVAVAAKAKDNDSLSYEESEKVFAELMNKKAKELGCVDSNFVNPHGYQDTEHYTSAYDMALISKEALKNEVIKKIAAETSYSGSGADNSLENSSSLKIREYNWKSHNSLITPGEYKYDYATGIKTGFTDEAGDCVSASAKKDDIQLIAVVFNSEDPNRWIDSKTLFEYGYNNFGFQTIQKSGEKIESVGLANHNRLHGDTVDVIIKEDVVGYLANDDIGKIEKVIEYNQDLIAENKDSSDKTIHLKAPLAKDTEVGTVTYKIDDEVIKETKLYTANDVEKRTILSSIKYTFKNIPSKILTKNGLITTAVIAVVIILLIIVIKSFKRRSRRGRKYKFKSNRRRRY